MSSTNAVAGKIRIPTVRTEHPIFTTMSTSSDPLLDNPKKEKISAWDRLNNYLIENNILTEGGEWVSIKPLKYPDIGPAQKARLHELFNTTFEIKMTTQFGLVIAAKTTLKEIIEKFGYAEFELIGSGVHWVLGEEYYRELLINMGVPDELIVDELFHDMREMPQDFDFQFSAPNARLNELNMLTHPIFQLLADKTHRDINEIIHTCKKKSYSKPENPEKFAMASFEFYYPDTDSNEDEIPIEDSVYLAPKLSKKAFDADFNVNVKLKRTYLTKGDSLKLKFYGNILDQFELQSNIEVFKEEALLHYLTQQIDSVFLKEINEKGLPILLVRTIKGRFPTKHNFLEQIPSMLIERHQAHNFGIHTAQAIATHSKNTPIAIIAAAINAFTLMSTKTGLSVLAQINMENFTGDSLLEIFGRLIKTNPHLQTLLFNLLTVQTYLGFGESVIAYKKKYGFFELKINTTSNKHISLFVKDDLLTALNYLLKIKKWDWLDPLLQHLSSKTTLNGPILHASCFELIENLLQKPNISAKTLGFLLLLKQHSQFPADINVRRLTNAFFICIPLWTDDATQRHAMLFAETLIDTRGVLEGEMHHLLRTCLEKFAEEAEPTIIKLAQILCGTRNSPLIYLTLTSLSSQNSDNASLAIKLTVETPHLGFEELVAVSKSSKTNQLEGCNAYVRLIERVSKHPKETSRYHAAKNAFDNLLPKWNQAKIPYEEIDKVRASLLSINPYVIPVVATSSKAVENKEEKLLENLLESVKKCNNTELAKYQNEFQNLSKKPNSTNCESLLIEILDVLLTRLQILKSKSTSPALSLLLSKPVKQLLKNHPDTLLEHCIRYLPTLTSSQTDARTLLYLLFAEVLTSMSPAAPTYLRHVHTITTELKAQKSPFPKTKLLEASLSFGKIMTNLYKIKAFTEIKDLFELCVQLKLDIKIGSVQATAIANDMQESLPSEVSGLRLAEDAYSLLAKFITSEIALKANHSFAQAWLSLDQPQNAVHWIRKLETFDPLIIQTLDALQTTQQWDLYEELLTRQNHLPAADLQARWQDRALQLNTDAPASAAHIFLSQHSLLVCISDIHVKIADVTQKLLASKNPLEHDLALKLLSTYQYPAGQIWEDVLLLICASPTKARIEACWKAIDDPALQELPLAIYAIILQKFKITNFYVPSLLIYLQETAWAESRFSRGDNEVQKNIREAFFNNACLCLKNGMFPTADFEVLNTYREAHSPQISISTYFQTWLANPSHEQSMQALPHLADHEAKGITIRLIPSKELFAKLSRVVAEDVTVNPSSSISRYFLKHFSAEAYKKHIVPTETAEVLFHILPPILRDCVKRRDSAAAELAINCFLTHRNALSNNIAYEEKIYQEIIRALPLLLEVSDKPKVVITHYQKYYQELVTNWSYAKPKGKEVQVKAALAARKEQYCSFRIKLLTRVVSNSPAIVEFILDEIIREMTDLLSNERLPFKAFSAFKTVLLSNLFEVTPVINEKRNAFLLENFDRLAKSGYFIKYEEEFLELNVYLHSGIHNLDLKAFTYKEQEVAALAALGNIFANPSAHKIKKAISIINIMMAPLRFNPIAVQESLNNLLIKTTDAKYNPEDRVEWLTRIHDNILFLLHAENYSEDVARTLASNLADFPIRKQQLANTKASWYLLAPKLIENYLKTTFIITRPSQSEISDAHVKKLYAHSKSIIENTTTAISQKDHAYLLHTLHAEITILCWSRLNGDEISQELIAKMHHLAAPQSNTHLKIAQQKAIPALLIAIQAEFSGLGTKALLLYIDILIDLQKSGTLNDFVLIYLSGIKYLERQSNLLFLHTKKIDISRLTLLQNSVVEAKVPVHEHLAEIRQNIINLMH